MKNKIFSFIMIIFSLVLIQACDDDGTAKSPVGSECDTTTTCDGVCNLALPGGMCIKPCSDAAPCETGTTCVQFTDDATSSYCVPSCTANEDCARDGYTCVDSVCRPLTELGQKCEEPADCAPCDQQNSCPTGASIDCIEGVCSIPCVSQEDCVEGTYCALSSDASASSEAQYWCIPVDFEQGPGKLGSSCAVNDCDSGYTCIKSQEEDALAYCSKECTSDRDCSPDMTCRDNGSGTMYCLKRIYCESCNMDTQCGYQTDKCISVNPSVDQAGGGYCSRQCDPDRRGTCPLDSSCKEAFFCEDLHLWVEDCSWCPSESACDAGSPSVYQCFNDYGSCVGEGNLCEPCHTNDDCSAEGACLSLSSTFNYVCTEPCDENGWCADGFMCVDAGDKGYQCMPRTGGCTEPSGGKETCDICSDWSDCLRGGCLPPSGDMNDASYCLDYCINNSDCGPYATCEELVIYGTYHFNVCLPVDNVGSCSNWQTCEEECPGGPSDCASGPSFCQ